MQLIAVTDIYGRTQALEDLLKSISKRYDSIKIIDPYDSVEIDFKSEKEAYDYFQKTIGLNGYIEKLRKFIKRNQQFDFNLLGFSMGASAIWAISGMIELKNKTKAICFYSSQIRSFLDIHPNIEIDLYFSKTEPCYRVDDVIDVLTSKSNVNCYKTNYFHGFMNRKSKNYSNEVYSEYLEILKT